jgi:hypothetical protein
MLKKKDKKEKSPMENLNKSIENYIFCKLYVYKFKHFMKFTLPSFSIFCLLLTIVIYKLFAPTTLFLYTSLFLDLFLILIYFLSQSFAYTVANSNRVRSTVLADIKKYGFQVGITLDDMDFIIEVLDTVMASEGTNIKSTFDLQLYSNLIFDTIKREISKVLSDNNTEFKD